jgi:hypothetical protein
MNFSRIFLNPSYLFWAIFFRRICLFGNRWQRAPPVSHRAPRQACTAARRSHVAATRRGLKPLSGQRAARPDSYLDLVAPARQPPRSPCRRRRFAAPPASGPPHACHRRPDRRLARAARFPTASPTAPPSRPEPRPSTPRRRPSFLCRWAAAPQPLPAHRCRAVAGSPSAVSAQ